MREGTDETSAMVAPPTAGISPAGAATSTTAMHPRSWTAGPASPTAAAVTP